MAGCYGARSWGAGVGDGADAYLNIDGRVLEPAVWVLFGVLFGACNLGICAGAVFDGQVCCEIDDKVPGACNSVLFRDAVWGVV